MFPGEILPGAYLYFPRVVVYNRQDKERNMEQGLVHIYYGDGKGKTTAAAGLALRCLGAGKRVVFAQFLKPAGGAEARALSRFPEAACLAAGTEGFLFQMTQKERENCAARQKALFTLCTQLGEETDLLILDEILDVCAEGLLDRGALTAFLKNRPEPLEVVLTGRDAGEFLALADYATEMQKKKHPYDGGIKARKGIEY